MLSPYRFAGIMLECQTNIGYVVVTGGKTNASRTHWSPGSVVYWPVTCLKDASASLMLATPL